MVGEVAGGAAGGEGEGSRRGTPGGRGRVAGSDVGRDGAAGEKPHLDASGSPEHGVDTPSVAVERCSIGAGAGVGSSTTL